MSFLDKFPRVNSCCFCINLRTGAKIISVLQIVGCALVFIMQIIALMAVPMVVQFSKEQSRKEGKEPTEEDIAALTTILYVGIAIWICFCIPAFVLAIFLTVGVFKERAKYIKVWLWVQLILMILAIPFFIYEACGGGQKVYGENAPPIAATIVGRILGIALSVYWWLNLNTFRLELEENQNQAYKPAYNRRNDNEKAIL